jgi:capsular exopolysaccharide synthesis family protein
MAEMNAGRLLGEPPISIRNDALSLAALQEMYGSSGRERTVGDYWRILLKRKWVVVISVVVALVMGGLISARMTPIYEAATRILIAPQIATPLIFKDNNTSQATDDQQRDIDTKVKIIQSDTNAELVIHRLNLDTRAEFAGAAQRQTSGGIAVSDSPATESSRAEQLIHKLQAGLRVQQVPDTSLVEIKYSDPNASLAAELADATAATFIEQNVKSRYESTMAAADWLSKQLADLQIKMESSQSKLIQYEKEHNIVGADDKQNLTTEKLDALGKEVTAAEADRIQKQSLYQIATGDNPDTLSAVLQDPILTGLRQRQTDLQAQYALLSTEFGPGYPKLLEIKNQLEQVNKDYREQVQTSVSRIKNDYQAAVNRENMLKSALAEQTSIADKLNESTVEYKVLKQEADSNRQLYDGLLQQLKEASLAAGLDSSNIRVVDKARVPLHSSSPNVPRNLEFALLIGLVGGIAMAFGMEALDTTVRTPEQAENISGLPTLGVIPLQGPIDAESSAIARGPALNRVPRKSSGARALISYLEPQSEIAEAYRALRTSILLSSPSHPPRSILVTSSVPQDGKTMTCINIAIVLAQQGKRVLLIDADMRRPSIHRAFSLRDQIGLSNILAGVAQANEAIQATVQPNLFVIPAGPIPPHPAELLSSSLMEELLNRLCDQYDHVIIDSPPVIFVTDPVLLSVQTEAVLLIIRSGQTTAAHVRRARNLLQSVKARLLGIVVNAADLASPDYYYYYGPKYLYYSSKEQDAQKRSLNNAKDPAKNSNNEQDNAAPRT